MALKREFFDKAGLNHIEGYINLVNVNFLKTPQQEASLHLVLAVYASEQHYIDGFEPVESMTLHITEKADIDSFMASIYNGIKGFPELTTAIDV